MKVKEFCNLLQMQGKHPKTIQNYERYIEELLVYAQKEKILVQDIQTMHMKQYLSGYKQTKSEQTVLYAISSLKQYFKFLRMEQIMVHNPMELLDVQVQASKDAAPVVPEDVYRSIVAVLSEKEGYNRERVALHLMYEYKCNVAAAIRMRWEQYRPEQGILYAKRALSLREETVQLLNAYKEKNNGSEWMFCKKTGAALTESGMNYLVRKALDACGFREWKLRDFYKKGTSITQY